LTPCALIVVVPGWLLGWMCKCGVGLHAARAQSAFGDAEGAETQEIVCEACGERYALRNDNLARVG
jgi:hypothetical protein